MSYSLNQASNPLAIGPQQFAQLDLESGNNQGALLRFSTLLSSVGIAVVSNGNLIGINLPLYDNLGETFTAADVATVLNVLQTGLAPGSTPPCIVFGQLAYWENSASQAYQALITALAPQDAVGLGNVAPAIGVNDGGVPYLIQS
ncbi:hypothetical protein JR064_01360 [Xanthomonas sp. CFBP 8703]|uniref:Uncharacterized protein n=1 Tax=Xanthomonas bonasiae TaxID=2810351 RepID=A0ABS3AZT3_9XANT|nr:hypothetical protein [Xanthomonas bonasiae]MBN6100810.1 hypothetical protein [Xanthomonas bonasiae]